MAVFFSRGTVTCNSIKVCSQDVDASCKVKIECYSEIL